MGVDLDAGDTRDFFLDPDEVLAARGTVPVKAKAGKTRLIKTDTGRVVTHGDLVRGLLKREGVEAAVVDGKRPTWVSCQDCQVRVPVRGGPIPLRCRVCTIMFKRAKKREYRVKNAEKLLARQREYHVKNAEKILTRQREYHVKNAEKIYARKRKYQAKNPEKIHVQRRAARVKNAEKRSAKKREYRVKNLEKIRAKEREYRVKNAEKIRAKNRVYAEKIRAKKASET